MKDLPNNITAYKQTPEFTETTVPKGLLNDHTTKEGVWGKIIIVSGKLEYIIQEPVQETIELSPEKYGVVEPTIKHRVKPLGQVTFYVEFYR